MVAIKCICVRARGRSNLSTAKYILGLFWDDRRSNKLLGIAINLFAYGFCYIGVTWMSDNWIGGEN